MMRAALVGTGTVVGIGVVLGLNPTGTSTAALSIPLVPAGTPAQDGAAVGPVAPPAPAGSPPASAAARAPSVTPRASTAPSSAQHAARAVSSQSPSPSASRTHAATTRPTTSATAAPTQSAAPKASPSPHPTASATPSPSPTSNSATGPAVDVGYGIVQVQATVKGGRLIDIQAVQLPFSDPISKTKSETAWPVLVQEAIQAQSAQIAAVSGASYTSWGFAQSLASALQQLGHSA